MLSTMTFKEFESQVRADTGADDYSEPNTPTIMRWTNVILQKIALLTGAIDGAWGRNTSTLTLLQDGGAVIYPGGGGSYTSATKILTGFPSTLDQTYIGGLVFFYDGANSRGHYGIIETLVSTIAVTLRFTNGTGAIANIASANLSAIAKPNPAFYNGANLNGVGVRDIVKIVDGTNGNVVRVDGDVFAGFASNPNYDSSVISEYAGEGVFFGKGANISALGTLTMTFEEKPTVLTASTDAIDLLPEHLSALRAEVDRWVLNYMNKPIPKELDDPLASLTEQFKKHAQDLAHRRMKADVPARRN